MIGMTMCSGIGAPEVAAPWVDWRFASEIELFPREVLQQRLGYRAPEDHNQGDPLLWGDMTEISPDLLRARGIPLPDLVVAGTPCQAFSVAGLRMGTADARGNLTLKFVEILHELVAARPDGKLAVLWENVPGVLSDKGNAFGAFLGGLVGADDAFEPPEGSSWPGLGMVSGPRARAAWRVLDAQFFGVAQRRRRVFVVVDFGNCVDPAAVLFEPKGLRGDTPPRREAGQGVAGSLSARSTGGGGLGTDFDCDGGLIPQAYGGNNTAGPIQIATAVNAHGGSAGRLDFESETFIAHSHQVAHALRGEGFDASEGGTGRGTPPVPVAIQERAVSENPSSGPDGAGIRQDGTAYTLEARSVPQAVAFDTTQITSAANYSNPRPGDPCHPLAAGAHPPAVAQPWAVRRLTPTECHRLQGFSDDHCAVTYRNKPAADGPQYKALGNSMAVPCIKWILDRVRISWEAKSNA